MLTGIREIDAVAAQLAKACAADDWSAVASALQEGRDFCQRAHHPGTAEWAECCALVAVILDARRAEIDRGHAFDALRGALPTLPGVP